MDIVLILLWYLIGVLSILVYFYFEQGKMSRSDVIVTLLFGTLGIFTLLCIVIVYIIVWAHNDHKPFIMRKEK